MKPITRRSVMLGLLVLALFPALASAKALMTAPAKASIGARIRVNASGLTPGHYTLELGIQVLSGGGTSPTICVGNVGSAVAHDGRLAISGRLPTRLGCYTGAGPVEGHIAAKPGTYRLTLGVEFHANGFNEGDSFITQRVHLTP